MTLEIELVRLRNGVDVKRELLQFRMLLRFVKDNWFQFGKSKSQRKNCSDMELRCGGDGFQYGGWVAQHIIAPLHEIYARALEESLVNSADAAGKWRGWGWKHSHDSSYMAFA